MCNLEKQAAEYAEQAGTEKEAGNYAKAFPLYLRALECFKILLKNQQDPKIKEAFTDCLLRAEEIRAFLDKGPSTRLIQKHTCGAIVRETPNIKWDHVAGLETAKQALLESVVWPLKFRRFFTGKRQPWRAVLLYGPPGTGKSYLAKAVAAEANATLFRISTSDLVSNCTGESEKLVSNLFQMARKSSPAIIFVDELDSLCEQRGEGNESEASKRIKTEMLVQMEGGGHIDDKVVVLAATNTPYALDKAIMGGFDKLFYIPLPEAKAREHMFKVHLGDTHNLSESDFEALGRKSEGFSGSDVSVCIRDVLLEAVREIRDAMFFIKSSIGTWMPCGPKQPGAIQITMQEIAEKGLASQIIPAPISKEDFDKVLARQSPTVSQSDIDVYERFTKEFAEEG